jgi:hypothetical protein
MLHGIKLLGLMHHGTWHLSISGLSNNLYLPITVANPRSNPSTVEDDQYYREPPIWMQSMVEWMGQHMKFCQQPSTGR